MTNALITLTFACLLLPGAGRTAEETELKLELPKPVFLGTPKHIPPGSTVDLKGPSKRSPLLVPAGTRILSLGKDVASSDPEPIIGEFELVTDGDKEATDGSYLELGPGRQYVQVDLGASCRIEAIAVWQYHGDPRVFHDVVVQVAGDADFISGVKALFNNDRDNSAGLGVGRDREYFETYQGLLVKAGGIKARYVRIYSQGSTADEMNRYTEVEVYGLPAK